LVQTESTTENFDEPAQGPIAKLIKKIKGKDDKGNTTIKYVYYHDNDECDDHCDNDCHRDDCHDWHDDCHHDDCH
jgi:hypothetical protein